MITATAWSRTISTSSDARDGVAIMMMFMVGGMLFATAVLIAYVLASPAGFPYFGVSLAAGYVIALGVIAVGMARRSFRD
jgi:hypothetical protein